MTTLDRIEAFAAKLASSRMPAVTTLQFDDAGVQAGSASKELKRDQDYFGLTINEICLAKGREWWSIYDPLVYVCVDFAYGRERISVPSLIGPSALRGKLPANDKELPHGFVMRDLRVLGPQVFRGGPVEVTIVLYRIRRNDYAKELLGLAESISSAIGVPAEISSLVKIGNVVIDAMESVLRISDAAPIIGHRIGLNPSAVKGLRSQSVALVAGNGIDGATARVVEGRLEPSPRTNGSGAQDYVLYSLWGMDRRETPTALPIFDIVDKMLECATNEDDGSWVRAKSMLVTLNQQMVISPDLTRAEADELYGYYKQRIVALHEEAEKVPLMSHGDAAVPRAKNAMETRLNERATEILNLGMKPLAAATTA